MQFKDKKTEFIYYVQKSSFLKGKYETLIAGGANKNDENMLVIEKEIYNCLNKAQEIKEQIEKESAKSTKKN